MYFYGKIYGRNIWKTLWNFLLLNLICIIQISKNTKEKTTTWKQANKQTNKLVQATGSNFIQTDHSKNGNLNWQNFLGRQIQSFKKQNNPENTENK